MNKTPFKYGTTVSSSSFTNRQKERERLTFNFLNHINTIIISPRRWGKSSLVEKVVNEFDSGDEQIKIVVIDLFSVSSEQEFLETFAKEAIKASDYKWENWIKITRDVFKTLIPQFSFGIDPQNDFTLKIAWEELQKNKDEILDLPEIIAEKKGIKFVICLDEFQNLASFKGYEELEKLMRSVWQRQKNVTYCLYGSKRHMMTELFNSSSKPFYRFGELMLLQKITEEDWIQYITHGFRSTNKEIEEELAQKIAQKMKNHPWYVQQLANYVWQKTHEEVTHEILEEAIEEVINTNSPFYQSEIEKLSRTQLHLLKAILNGEEQLTSVKTMQDYQLGTPNNVSKNIESLKKIDLIDQTNNQLSFLDPVFEMWFCQIFGG